MKNAESDLFDAHIMYPPANAKVKCLRFGREQEPVVVIDNAVSVPDDLRRYAVEKNKFARADNFYPGVRMPAPKLYTAALAKNLELIIKKVFGLDARGVQRATSQFSIVTDKPESLSLMQRVPHIDAATENGLAAIHYLINDENTGTAFYRHQTTGYEHISAQRYTGYITTLKNELAECPPEGYVSSKCSQFEAIGKVDAVYNRVVLYRGASLHSGIIPEGCSFDASPETGRLTITSFYTFS